MLNYRSFLWVGICFSLFLFACQSNKSPFQEIADEAIPQFQIADGFEIELIAAEPLISDPVAMEVDEYGRLYVVEMPGYPLDLSKTGKVKRLIDTDLDGFPDKSVVFADSLTLPTGIMRWKDGFIVTDAPDVLYLADTNGDDRADIREVLLTGFALSNPQHNFNTPVYGLDNWIYLANEYHITTKSFPDEFGDEGSEVFFPAFPNAPRLPKNAGAKNIRFKPDSYLLEMGSGRSQYGQAFDPWGHHFTVNNAEPLFHEVIAASYLKRNPKLLVSDAMQYMPENSPAQVFPITENPEHQLLTDVGVITSACGISWYGGGTFPDTFNNVIFVAEPVHNLLQANYIKPEGATFSSEPLNKGEEFLASKDSWFRPVFTYVGPDGALYVVDYYRQIVEHPEWMSDEINNSGQLYNGTDKGRIYRISPKASPDMRWIDQLQMAYNSGLGLTKTLENPNIWWRRNAQRILVDRDDKENEKHLSELMKGGRSPFGRVHGLWTLHALDQLDPVLIDLALKDTVAGVRENAIQIAEMYMPRYPALLSQLIRMARERDPRVRFQLLCSLGSTNNERANIIRQYLLDRGVEDPWMHTAALSAIPGVELETFEQLSEVWKEKSRKGRTSFFERLAALIALNGETEKIERVIELCTSPDSANAWWQAAGLRGLAEGLKNSRDIELSSTAKSQISTNLRSSFSQIQSAAISLAEILSLKISGSITSSSRQLVQNEQAELDRRVNALKLLILSNSDGYRSTFIQLISPKAPSLLQKTALDGLASIDGTDIVDVTLEKWPTLSPEIRDHAIGLCMAYKTRMSKLLDALEAGTIQPTNIGWRRTVRLMNHRDEELRDRARKLLSDAFRDRGEALEEFKPALELIGNADNGQKIFQTYCATCHQIGGVGKVNFGPDLASVRNRSKTALMRDIIVPNHSIADRYEMWSIDLKNGENLAGIIREETTASITIIDLTGKETTIARSDIEQLVASPQSAMPAGLESQMSQQDMADLLAFFKGEK